MTETEYRQALTATRLELRRVERDRDEWKRRADMHARARRVTARAMSQVQDDADNAWRRVEELGGLAPPKGMDPSPEAVAFP